jgi:hypothetical protein
MDEITNYITSLVNSGLNNREIAQYCQDQAIGYDQLIGVIRSLLLTQEVE